MTAPEDHAFDPEAVETTDAAPAPVETPSPDQLELFALDRQAPKAVLLTTTSGDEAAAVNLERMLKGLLRQVEGGANVVSIILVQQDEAQTEALRAKLNPPSFVEMIAAGRRMSLSAARNVMLTYAAETNLIASDDVVAFPDDDSWYPEDLLGKVQYLFASDPFFDFFFCRYGETTETCHLSRINQAPRTQCVITNASSNTIFVRGRVANLVGGFDEDLGVGAKHKSGEDLDYALRAFHQADQRAFLDAQIVGHRDKNPAIRAKYYRGSLLVLSRYALRSSSAAFALFRKLAVGALFVATLRLSAREFASLIWLAAEELGRGEKSA